MTRERKKLRRDLAIRISTAMLLASTGVAMALIAAPAMAQQAARAHSFAIPAQPLSAALVRFGQASGLQVFFDERLTAGRRSPALDGTMTSDAALLRLLAGSGLSYRFNNANTVSIVAPQAQAQGQVSGAEGVVLNTVTLNAQSAYGPVQGYIAQSSVTAMKGDIALIETPQSVSVVTADQMRDQGAQSVNDALRYTAGVRTESSGAQPMDNALYVRGFQQSSLDMYYDGLRGATPGYFGFFAAEPYGFERVEVLKGPSSVLYGQQTPGGLINAVSKRPSADPVNEVEMTLGSFNQRQLAFDWGWADPERALQYRLVGLGRLADTQVDHVENDRVFLAPSLTWAPSDDTSLTLLGSFQRNAGDFYAQVPAAAVLLPNSNGHIPFSRFIGEPGWEGETSKRLALGWEFQHRFSDTLTFQQNLRYSHLTNHREYLQASGGLIDERVLNRRYTVRDISSDGVTLDNRLNLSFDTGAVHHQATVGLDYLWGTSHWLEQSGTASPIDIYDPVYGNIPDTSVYTSQSVSDISTRQVGLYLQDQLRMDNWILTLGGRQDWSRRVTENLTTGVTTRQSDDAFTGRAGLTYLFASGLAPYVSYSQSFTPLIGLDRHGNPYVPETGTQWEIGLKYQPTGGNSAITLSAYDLRRQNVQTADPEAASWDQYVQTGEIRTRGFEVEASTELANGLSVLAAYTYTDAQITDTNTAGQLGNTPYRIPRHAASLWLNYAVQATPLAGLQLGLGARYTGKTWGDDDNTFQVPGFTLFDASVSYDFGVASPKYDGLRASLNVSNLFDKYAVPACFSVNACNYGALRTVTGTLSYRW